MYLLRFVIRKFSLILMIITALQIFVGVTNYRNAILLMDGWEKLHAEQDTLIQQMEWFDEFIGKKKRVKKALS